MKSQAINKFSKTMIIPIVLGLILLILFKGSDSRLEQIMIGSIFLMVLLPFVLQLLTMLLFSASPKPQTQRVAENIVKGGAEKYEIKSKESIKTDYKVKTNNNPLYHDVRNRLIEVIKGGTLSRDAILKFRMELDNRLGANRYAYNNFTYENEAHEIYIKLKSSKLNDDDYVYLKGILEDLVG